PPSGGVLVARPPVPTRRSSDLVPMQVHLDSGRCSVSRNGAAAGLEGAAVLGGRLLLAFDRCEIHGRRIVAVASLRPAAAPFRETDRKSTRLNSSHGSSSYAVFC